MRNHDAPQSPLTAKQIDATDMLQGFSVLARDHARFVYMMIEFIDTENTHQTVDQCYGAAMALLRDAVDKFDDLSHELGRMAKADFEEVTNNVSPN